MALGALTQLNLDPAGSSAAPVPQHFSGLQVRRYTQVGDTSYVTGGSVLSAATLGFPNTVLWATVSVKAATGTNSGAVAARYDEVNGKLQCFASSGVSPVALTEVANAVNLSGLTFDIVAFGY